MTEPKEIELKKIESVRKNICEGKTIQIKIKKKYINEKQ